MQDTLPPGHRIWSHAFLAAVALVLAPTMAVSIAWFVSPTVRDQDMAGVHELIFTFVMFLTMPALLLSLGVLAPSAIALDHIARGRASRRTNVLLGALLGVPALAAFVIGGALLNSGPDRRAFVANLARPVSVALQHPARTAVTLSLFALAGVIVALGMRARTR